MKKLLLLFLLIITNSYSQTNASSFQPPKLSPPTPEVFSLFKFTDIPVSNTTGIPNISIPIHTIKLKDFEFPISLSYNSSGIRIEEIASNVGLGWSLNSGGMIYNQVNGLDDYETSVTFQGASSHIPQNRELDPVIENQNNPTNPDYYDAVFLTAENFYSIPEKIDTQPDIYYYNCGNLSGKFFFTKDGVAATMPYTPIKIQRSSYYTFTITDEKGTKYTFDRISETTTLSKTIETPRYYMSDSENKSYTFHITKIETINKDIINFNYEEEKYSYLEPSIFSSRESTYQPSGMPGEMIPGGLPLYVETETINTVILKGKRLLSITTNTNENIQFLYENCPRIDLPPTNPTTAEALNGGFALKEIKINSSTKNDSYTFKYGYFNLPNYTDCTYPLQGSGEGVRLKLKSVKKNAEPPYQFNYNENAELPSRLIPNYDHWGYFKSSGGRYSVDYALDFSDGVVRNPELEMTKLGVLNKIIYPTSGYTEFDYELNDYYGLFTTYATRVDRSVSNYIVGQEELGLPNEAQYLEKPFEIVPGYVEGSAIITMEISAGEQTTNNFVNIYLTDNHNNPVNFTYKYLNLGNTTSTHLVYRLFNVLPGNYILHVDGIYSGGGARIEWKEKIGTDTNEMKNINVGGLRVKSITNYANQNSNIPASRKFYQYKKIENPTQSSGLIIADPRYSYVETKCNPSCSSSASISINPGCMTYRCRNSKNFLPLAGLQGYHIIYPEVRIYDDENLHNGYIDYKYSIAYDNKSYSVLRNTPATSHDFKRGDLLEQNFYKYNAALNKYTALKKTLNEYYYNFNENSSFFDSAQNPNEKHALGLVINKLTKDISCQTSTNGVIWQRSTFEMSYFKLYSVWKYLKKSTETIFDENGNNPIIVETNYKYNNPLHCQTTNIITSNSENKSIETKIYYPQDPEMANQPFVNELIANNRISSPLDSETYNGTTKLSEQLTIYDKSTATSNLLLPRKVYMAKFPNILPTVLDNRNLENKITYDQYDPSGNILQYTLENGTSVSIIWGYNKTLPIAKIENATNAQIASILGNVNNLNESQLANINALRSNPAFANTMISTYSHIPFVGVSTITDPKGETITYNYDSFGRLETVKDKDNNILSENQYNYKQ